MRISIHSAARAIGHALREVRAGHIARAFRIRGLICLGLLLGCLPLLPADDDDDGHRPGLVGHYYKDSLYWGGNWTESKKVKVDPEVWTFWRYAYSRVEPRINHQFTRSSWFSVRWCGYVDTGLLEEEFDEAEFVFQVKVAGACRVYIDGKIVIDSWKQESKERDVKGKVKLNQGRHKIRVEYFLGLNSSLTTKYPLKLRWSSKALGLKPAIIAPACFTHSVEDLTPKPGLKD